MKSQDLKWKPELFKFITGTIKKNTGKLKKESYQTPVQACRYQAYWRQLKFWHCGEAKASSKHIKWAYLEAHYNTGRGRGKGGTEPSQTSGKYCYISDARDNYRKEWIGHVPKMEEVTRIPKLFMTNKSVANVDMGHLEKRRGTSTLGTTHISIYKLKQKRSKSLLHLNKSQTEAELVTSL